MFFKPVAGRQVPRPDGSFVPPEGCNVEDRSYWHRRVLDGDGELFEQAPEASEGEGKKKKGGE